MIASRRTLRKRRYATKKIGSNSTSSRSRGRENSEMQHRIRSLTLAILAVLALSALDVSPYRAHASRGLFAQTARPSGGTTVRPDLSGTWQEETMPGVPAGVFTKEEPPMLPWAIEKSRVRSRGTRQEVDD